MGSRLSEVGIVLPGLATGVVVSRQPTWSGELVYDDTPPSLNAVGSRGNATGAHWPFTRAKRDWQSTIETLLMQQRAPRNLREALAGARMRFPRPNTRRDSGNFAMVLEKALGDALVKYGAIDDDTADKFFFAGVEFEPVGGPKRTRITVHLV